MPDYIEIPTAHGPLRVPDNSEARKYFTVGSRTDPRWYFCPSGDLSCDPVREDDWRFWRFTIAARAWGKKGDKNHE